MVELVKLDVTAVLKQKRKPSEIIPWLSPLKSNTPQAVATLKKIKKIPEISEEWSGMV